MKNLGVARRRTGSPPVQHPARISRCGSRHQPDSGPCGGPTDTGPCLGHLYAHARDGFATCPVCGAQHDVAERRAWMTGQRLDMLVTAPVALEWVRLLMDHA